MTPMKKMLIMAAGTGGHIFPGLAIADTMRQRGWQVTWLGTTHGMEGELVPRHNIEMDRITFSGLRGKGLANTLRGAWRLLISFPACFSIIGQRQPDVVLGMGGYITIPGGVMARLRGVPLVLVNADATLLLSNKMLAPLAQRVLFGLPATLGNVADKAQVTGNPVRKEITQLPSPEQRYSGRIGPLRLLVVGGSLGAKALNDCLPAALAMMPAHLRPSVTHQSGKQHIAALQAAYNADGVAAEVVAFIDDMPRRYAYADLVVCRAGAMTVSELTAAGVASVLIPFVASTTSHQRDNARWMATKKAAIYLPQNDLNKERLFALLSTMTRQDCKAMAQAAYENGRRDANHTIAQVLEELAVRKQP
ncbi:MAG: undecaprenyldiphospho-muramoylpentapeptide beta-N-acetylglucosaminyltransferase [Glaciimonas sp.]|nr:undecaprenyldiphospho-muramoylpentapeptide beta-N-acetylglucosaminyltransferase [Glaciimonas sp.]